MKRTALQRNPQTTRDWHNRSQRSTARKQKPQAISPATPAQRARVRLSSCLVCQNPLRPVEPAHLIDRSLCPDGADDPRAVVGLCAQHHREYDDHTLDLLGYLEPHYREELAFAVLRFGLVSTYKRVTGDWDVRVNERSDDGAA